MFQSQAAEVLSVVANQTCVCAAYGDGRNTVVAERLRDDRIVASVNGVVVGVFDRRQLKNDRDIVNDIVTRIEEFIRAQNEMPAVDADGQAVNKFR